MPTVLVLDDDLATLAYVEEVLIGAGCHVLPATTAAYAFDILASRRIDLMVMEMLLPGKEGVEMLLEIRQRWPTVPVLAMSGGGAVVSAHEALAFVLPLGGCASLRKPFTPLELLEALDACLAAGPSPANDR